LVCVGHPKKPKNPWWVTRNQKKNPWGVGTSGPPPPNGSGPTRPFLTTTQNVLWVFFGSPLWGPFAFLPRGKKWNTPQPQKATLFSPGPETKKEHPKQKKCRPFQRGGGGVKKEKKNWFLFWTREQNKRGTQRTKQGKNPPRGGNATVLGVVCFKFRTETKKHHPGKKRTGKNGSEKKTVPPAWGEF